MRLTEEQVRQGILHEDPQVRFAALQYFAESFSRNPTVMPVAIEALQRWGVKDAFVHSYPIAHLAQTDQTIAWIMEQLQHEPMNGEAGVNLQDHLSRTLLQCDPSLVLEHEAEIIEAPGFKRELIGPFVQRIRYLSLDGASLWRELEAICEEGKDKEYVNQVRYPEGLQIVEALARDRQHAERMMSLLRHRIEDFDNNPLTWLEPLLVYMAGEMRYEPAIPIIVDKLREDGEVLNEECMTAFAKIGTDAVVSAVREVYPTAEEGFRLFASNVFGRIHSDLAVAAGLELLQQEPVPYLQVWLATALVDQFSTAANEAAHNVLLTDPDEYDLKHGLVTACTLMGQQFPELSQWRTELQNRPRRLWMESEVDDSMSDVSDDSDFEDELDDEPIETRKKVGRNDPCPCGSGKKFKKCCLNKPPL